MKKQPRKTVFMGAYVPPELKKALTQLATAQRLTLSAYITKILTDHIEETKKK